MSADDIQYALNIFKNDEPGMRSIYGDLIFDTIVECLANSIARADSRQTVDVEKLKQSSAALDQYNHAGKARVEGWNACLYHLASQGYLTTPQHPVSAPVVSREDAQKSLDIWMRYNVMIQPVHDYKCVSYKTFRCTCNAENEFTDIEFMKIRIRTLLEAAAKETSK